MKHTIQIRGGTGAYYLSAGCSCGNFSFFRNLPKSRGYRTDAVKRARELFKQHKAEAK
jgi:hypothetical protein